MRVRGPQEPPGHPELPLPGLRAPGQRPGEGRQSHGRSPYLDSAPEKFSGVRHKALHPEKASPPCASPEVRGEASGRMGQPKAMFCAAREQAWATNPYAKGFPDLLRTPGVEKRA